MKRDKNGCIYRQFGVTCYDQDEAHCQKCVWNPAVEAKRKAKLLERKHDKRVRNKA